MKMLFLTLKITGRRKGAKKFGQKRALTVETGKKEASYLPQTIGGVARKVGTKRLRVLLLVFQPLYFLC